MKVEKIKDAHTEHCCLQHGCKYGDDDCTVITGKAEQSFRCELCLEEDEWDQMITKLEDENEQLRIELAVTKKLYSESCELSYDFGRIKSETISISAFANEIISAAFEGGSFEGGDIQDMAVKFGLLEIQERAEECGEICACREYGFPAECYRKASILLNI